MLPALLQTLTVPVMLLMLFLQQSPCHHTAAAFPPLLTLQALLHLVDPPVLLPLPTLCISLIGSPALHAHNTAPLPAPFALHLLRIVLRLHILLGAVHHQQQACC